MLVVVGWQYDKGGVIVLDMERIVRQVAARYESSLYLHE